MSEILMLILSYWIKKRFINLRTVILIKRWHSDECEMYEHLIGVIKQWRKWKETDNNGIK